MSVLKLINQSNKFLSRPPLTFSKFGGITKYSSTVAEPIKDPGDWNSIYRFPFIKFVAAFHKLKVYQGAFTVVFVPVSTFIPDFSSLVVAYVGVTGFLTLSAASYILRDTVGFVYTSDTKQDLVKFAFVDFWGKRKDKVMKVEDVMALSEMPVTPTSKMFTTLQFYNGHRKLKIFQNFGGIRDPSEFARVFGEER